MRRSIMSLANYRKIWMPSTVANIMLSFRNGHQASRQSGIICAWSENKKVAYSNYVMQAEGWLEFKYPVSVLGVYNLYVGYCDRIGSEALLTYKLDVSEKRRQ